MVSWEQAFEQTFPGTLTLAQALNRNPEELEAGLLDKLQKQGYKELLQKTLQRWLSGQNQ